MKKFSLLFAFLLTLFSGTSAWAETASFENSTLPEGWDVVGSLSYYTYTGGQVHTGSGSIYSSSNNGYNTSRGNYIRTKKLSGDITFWYRRYSSSNGTGYIVLYYLNDDGSLGDKIQAYSSTSSTYTSQTYTISTPTRLAIVVNYAYLDDVSYEVYVDKTVPWGLTATDVTATSATLGWNAVGEETAWQIAYGPTSDSFDADNATKVSASSTTYNFTGLTDGTTYDMCVRVDNGNGTYGKWSKKISFKASNEKELTVNDGSSTTYYLPFYASQNSTVAYGGGQFIIPATSLGAITDRKITKLTFYANTTSSSWGNLEYEVFLKEVDKAAFSSTTFDDWSELSSVYIGKVSIVNGKMEITLSTPLIYEGNNLLIGFKQSVAGTNQTIQWYCKTGAAKTGIRNSSGYNYTTTDIPKITFTTLPVATVNVTGVSLNESELTLDAGQSETLTAIISPNDATDTSVSWSSNDETVATVDANGLVTAVGAGTATITVTTTDGGFTATCEVTVNAATAVTGVSLNKDVTSIFVGSNETLTATVSPANATNKAVTWTSSDETVATVDNGVVTALKAGTTTITVTTVDGNFTATCAVTVQNVAVTGVTLNESSLSLLSNEAFTLTATVTPDNATIKTVTWTSSDETVAIVSEAGVVTAVGNGTATITATSTDNPGVTATCTVTVTVASTVTVNDGTATSSYVPVYGMYVDDFEKVEFIIPATSETDVANETFTDIDGGTIKKLTFYLSSPASASWGEANFKVYMKEVENTTISSFSFTDADEVLYDGSLDGTQSTMTISLTTPYVYNGGNLLVGIYTTKEGTYKSASFYGVTAASGSSRYGTNATSLANITSGNAAAFLPKTTFTYIPGVAKGKMVVSTDAIDFGKITPASSAEDKQKTFTIANNTDKADLTNISVTYSDEYATDAFSLNDNIATSIAAGGEAITVTVTMDAATVGTYNGTITVSADDNDPVNIAVSGQYAEDPATIAVTYEDSAVPATVAFGECNRNVTKTFSVTNDGDLPLNITSITSSVPAAFTVSPATLTVSGGETETFTVTFNYDATAFDTEKNANITVTPSNEGLAPVVFAVTGTSVDRWSEEFEGTSTPTGWTNPVSGYTAWTFSEGVAYGGYSYPNNARIQTPLLDVESGKSLTIEAQGEVSYSEFTVYAYSKEGELVKTSNFNSDVQASLTSFTTLTVDGLDAGKYYFVFDAYKTYVERVEGFKLAALEEHEAEVESTTIAATGNQFVEYTASVDVKVTGTNNEELTAKFYIGETQYGSDVVKTVNAGDTETFTVTFTPQTAISGDAYFTIESADIAAFESSKTAVNIAAATVLDETVGLPDGLETGTKPSLVLNYTAKDGWNTIAVPFALTDEVLEAIFGEDYKIFELKSFEDKVITFQHATKYNGAYAAGYPFLVYVATAATHANGVVLFDVNVSTTTANYDTKSGVTFQSTYAPMAVGSLTGNFGATTDGEIRKAGDEASLKGFRAYFTGIPEGVQSRINFLDDDIPTGISAIEAAGQLDNIYNLNGQKVQSLKKGLYIINGKKVVIK